MGTQPSVSDLTNYILGNIEDGIDQLKVDGIRNIVLLSPYDLGQSGLVPSDDTALATAYSDALTAAESKLYTPGVNTYFVNVEQLMRNVQADPSAYGFAHTTSSDACLSSCSETYGNYYLFNDPIHVTSVFDTLIAQDAAYEITNGIATVPEPSTWTMMLAGFGALGAMFLRRRQKSMTGAL